MMKSPKFWAWSEINWNKKRDTSSSYEVRNVNGVVGVFHSSSDWISLKTHRMTPPTILDVALVLSSIRNQLVKDIGHFKFFRSTFRKCRGCIVLKIGFHLKLMKWLLPPYYGVAKVLGLIWNQLVKEIGHFRFVQSSFSKWNGWCIAQFKWFDFPQNLSNSTSPHIMMLPEFWADPKSIGQRN